MTEWNEFKWLELDKAANAMQGDTIVDARGILDAGVVSQAGLNLISVGR